MLTDKLPLFIVVIVLLGCLLLMIAFRSLLVPLTAAVMNLLAAGAAFGVVTAVFQYGFLAGPLGVGEGPIEAFLPVMMLAILFGLSMDYQVFLVSPHARGVAASTSDNRRAVRVGQAETGRVITAAATIMVCVFGSFLLGGQRVDRRVRHRARLGGRCSTRSSCARSWCPRSCTCSASATGGCPGLDRRCRGSRWRPPMMAGS